MLIFWQLQLGVKYCGQTNRHWLSSTDIENSGKKKPHLYPTDLKCPLPCFFFILGKKQGKVEFHKNEIIVPWTFNARHYLQLKSPYVHWKIAKFLTKHISSCKTDDVASNAKYFHAALKEIFPTRYEKYLLRATRNISMLHLECCTYSAQKFSWQGLAKSEMDSGKECSVQFWAPNGSNKLLESFLRVSSLQTSFLCSWIDDFDVTLIMRNQSLKKYNQQTTYLHPIFAKYLSSNVTLTQRVFFSQFKNDNYYWCF